MSTTRIHKVGDNGSLLSMYELEQGGWVIAENHQWTDGVFEGPEAAEASVALTDEEIVKYLGSVYRVDGQNRPVTLAEVQAAVAAVEGVG